MTIQPSCHICGRSIDHDPRCECAHEIARGHRVEKRLRALLERIKAVAIESHAEDPDT